MRTLTQFGLKYNKETYAIVVFDTTPDQQIQFFRLVFHIILFARLFLVEQKEKATSIQYTQATSTQNQNIHNYSQAINI